jgi:hypothetical protein
MGRPPYWKKDTNSLEHAASGIQKFTHLVQGSLSGRFVDFPERKPKLCIAPYRDDLLLASHNRETCWEGDEGIASLTL